MFGSNDRIFFISFICIKGYEPTFHKILIAWKNDETAAVVFKDRNDMSPIDR